MKYYTIEYYDSAGYKKDPELKQNIDDITTEWYYEFMDKRKKKIMFMFPLSLVATRNILLRRLQQLKGK